MPKFQKKPVVIEARQLTGGTAEWHSVYQWIENNTLGSFEPLAVIEHHVPYPESGVSIDPRDGRLIISTLEGLHWANPGDWIIRGVQGEFCPCEPDIFDATYEEVRGTVSSDMSEPRRAQLLTTHIDLLEVLGGNVNLPLGDQPISVKGAAGTIQVTCMNYGPGAKFDNWQVAAFPDGAAVDSRSGVYLGTVAADAHWPNVPAHVFVFKRK